MTLFLDSDVLCSVFETGDFCVLTFVFGVWFKQYLFKKLIQYIHVYKKNKHLKRQRKAYVHTYIQYSNVYK